MGQSRFLEVFVCVCVCVCVCACVRACVRACGGEGVEVFRFRIWVGAGLGLD